MQFPHTDHRLRQLKQSGIPERSHQSVDEQLARRMDWVVLHHAKACHANSVAGMTEKSMFAYKENKAANSCCVTMQLDRQGSGI